MLSLVAARKGLSPIFSIEVGGKDFGPDITSLVKRLEYEEAEGMASILRLNIANPDFVLTRKKLLQPGNELAVYFGYGSDIEFVGRAVIVKSSPTFPGREMPTIEVVGYSKDYQLMAQEPEKGKDRVWNQVSLDAVVSAVADRWKFETGDIDISGSVIDVVQKAGMSDWELVRGCANIDGYWAWVDGDANGKWYLHYKNPQKPILQTFELTLRYNSGEETTLESFDPAESIFGGITKLRVLATDCLKGGIINEEVDTSDSPADTKFSGRLDEDLPEPPASREAIKLFIKDYSFSIVPSRPFRNAGEATLWAKSWFARHRQDFIMARGRTLIGIPGLRSRQVHKISGLSEEFDGKYFFSRVAHLFSNEDGYVCDFSCRKVVED